MKERELLNQEQTVVEITLTDEGENAFDAVLKK